MCSLIKSNDPWAQLNAAFIAGEIGVHDDEISCGLLDLCNLPITVVRQAIDAIAFAKLNNYQGILRQLKELILNKRQEWKLPLVQREVERLGPNRDEYSNVSFVKLGEIRDKRSHGNI